MHRARYSGRPFDWLMIQSWEERVVYGTPSNASPFSFLVSWWTNYVLKTMSPIADTQAITSNVKNRYIRYGQLVKFAKVSL